MEKTYWIWSNIVNGTDAPVEPISPIESFYASVTRKTLEGQPNMGYEPEEKMTRIEALESYTINGAYAAFEEDIKGSIEIGKLADFTVLDQDILTIEEDKILDGNITSISFYNVCIFAKYNVSILYEQFYPMKIQSRVRCTKSSKDP